MSTYWKGLKGRCATLTWWEWCLIVVMSPVWVPIAAAGLFTLGAFCGVFLPLTLLAPTNAWDDDEDE